MLNRVRPPFNVDSFALAAAAAALSDDDYVAQSVAANKAGMQQLTAAFDALGLSYIPSVGNFIAFRVPEGMGAMDVYDQLLAKGVIVRPVANYEMPQYLRVSIGTQAENATFISALTAVLS